MRKVVVMAYFQEKPKGWPRENGSSVLFWKYSSTKALP